MTQRLALCLITLVLTGTACRMPKRVHDTEFAAVASAVRHAYCQPAGIDREVVTPTSLAWEGPHSVDEYIQVALEQNPEVQAARKNVEAQALQVPVVASLQDPTWNVTVQPSPVETAAGKQEVMLAASQKLPWYGKLDARACVAEAQTNVLRAHLAAKELDVIANVKHAYYELYFVQQAIVVTEEEQELLGDIRDVATTRYKTGGTSQQDVLRAELEISTTENELTNLRQQLDVARARLGRLLHIGPQSRLAALDTLPPENVPADLDFLQAQAVQARPELHAKLAEVHRDRLAVDVANLEYKPDVTLGATWIEVAGAGLSPVASGSDAVLLSVGSNLPIYRHRIDAAVRSAEAKAVASARAYDSLRDNTLEEVTSLFAKARSQREMLGLFREDILPKARQTLEVSSQAYIVGKVDFLQLIDNWKQLLRSELSRLRLESNLRQTMAELENVVGTMLGTEFDQELPAPHDELSPRTPESSPEE
ncbi:MAG: TolC family protein [Pirellulaceae bacterium]|nr:TolC family protein [Planctomycetales bacterium]